MLDNKRRVGGEKCLPKSWVLERHLPDEAIQKVVGQLRKHQEGCGEGLLPLRKIWEIETPVGENLLVHEELPAKLFQNSQGDHQGHISPRRRQGSIIQFVHPLHGGGMLPPPRIQPHANYMPDEHNRRDAVADVVECQASEQMLGRAKLPYDVLRSHDPHLPQVDLLASDTALPQKAHAPHNRHHDMQRLERRLRARREAEEEVFVGVEPPQPRPGFRRGVGNQDRNEGPQHARPIVPTVLRNIALTHPHLVQAQEAIRLLREVKHRVVGQERPTDLDTEAHIHEQRNE
mmetsp:Transcript_44308/g.125158  ORF Transcript_44308/g.125158 Transcript_44308/m.125158 type:complete len:289 (-) Transcript_44308:264-1130(-)